MSGSVIFVGRSVFVSGFWGSEVGWGVMEMGLGGVGHVLIMLDG